MKRLLTICVTIGALAWVAACSSPPDNHGIASVTTTAMPSASPGSTGPSAFIACMRQHGQQIADPQPNTEWRPDPPNGETTQEWDAARAICEPLLPGGGSGGQKAPPPEDMEKLRNFAVCMRAHDIDMTDPQTSGDRIGNMLIRGRFEHVTRAQLEADPVYQAALAACQDKLPVETKKDGE